MQQDDYGSDEDFSDFDDDGAPPPPTSAPPVQSNTQFWRDFRDGQGRKFYVNMMTNASQWDKPNGFIETWPAPPGNPSNINYGDDSDDDGNMEWQNSGQVWSAQSKNAIFQMPAFVNAQSQEHRKSIASGTYHMQLARNMESMASSPDYNSFLPAQPFSQSTFNLQHSDEESEEDSDWSDEAGAPPGIAPPTQAPPQQTISDDEDDAGFDGRDFRTSTVNTVSNVVEYNSDDDEEELENIEDRTHWTKWAETHWENFSFLDYAQNHFRPESTGWTAWNARTHKDDINWSKKLSASLIELEDNEAALAVENFVYVTKYCGDRKGTKAPWRYIEKVLASVLSGSQNLQDETFCQLMKQTNNNPCDKDRESKLKAWRFLAICCGIFPASQSLVSYLVAHLYKGTLEADQHIVPWAQYALERLEDTMVCGRRKYIPTQAELVAAEARENMQVELKLLDGSTIDYECDSQKRVDEAKKEITSLLGLNRPEFFGFFEMQNVEAGFIQNFFQNLREANGGQLDQDDKVQALITVPVERYCENSERVCDVISGWLYGPFNNRPGMEFVFRTRLIVMSEQRTLSAKGLELYFISACHAVNFEHYPIPEKLMWNLSALQVQAVFGVQDDGFFTNGTLTESESHHVSKFLPFSQYKPRQSMGIETKILTIHGHEYESLDRAEAQRMYLQTLTNMDKLEQIYGAQQFPVVRLLSGAVDRGAADLLMIYICEAGLSIIDPFKRKTVEFFPLSEILMYGYQQDAFLFIAGTLGNQKKFRMATYSGKEMNDLLLAHTQLKISKFQGEDDDMLTPVMLSE